MPELPEVETIASELHARLTGRRIEGVEILWPRTVGHPAPGEFASAAAGARVEGVGRRGKFILIRLDGGGAVYGSVRQEPGTRAEVGGHRGR